MTDAKVYRGNGLGGGISSLSRAAKNRGQTLKRYQMPLKSMVVRENAQLLPVEPDRFKFTETRGTLVYFVGGWFEISRLMHANPGMSFEVKFSPEALRGDNTPTDSQTDDTANDVDFCPWLKDERESDRTFPQPEIVVSARFGTVDGTGFVVIHEGPVGTITKGVLSTFGSGSLAGVASPASELLESVDI